MKKSELKELIKECLTEANDPYTKKIAKKVYEHLMKSSELFSVYDESKDAKTYAKAIMTATDIVYKYSK